MKPNKISALFALALGFSTYLEAGISASPFLVFMSPGNLIQNVIITNNDPAATAYVQVTPQLVENPGAATPVLKSFQPGDNPGDFGLLTTPLKLAIPANSQRSIRVSSLKGNTATDQLYYLTVAPVSMPTAASNISVAKIDLDVGIGYVVKVLILPPNPQPVVSATRSGTNVTIKNTGNSYISLRNGELCNTSGNDCTPLQTDMNYRVLFAGNTWSFKIPQAGIVKFNGVYAENKTLDVQSN